MSTPSQIASYACGKCGWADFHSTDYCPRCNAEISQRTIPGEGKIVTYTAIHYPPKGFEDQAPYIVAIIDLIRGPRVIGRISNLAEEVKIGSTVSLNSSKEGALVFRLSN